MSKIYVLHENDAWTSQLQRQLDERRLPYELWHLDEGLIDLSAKPPAGVFYSRISASAHTRNHRYAPELGEAVLLWLEQHNCNVVNGSHALRMEVSKVNQYTALEKAGITTPTTLAAVGKQNILDAARKLTESLLEPRFIIKHNRAGKGQSVRLFHSVRALEAHLHSEAFEAPVDGIMLVQQYIDSAEPVIVRHEFINGRFYYGVRVDTSAGFALCPAEARASPDDLASVPSSTSDAMFHILDEYRPEFIDRYEAFLANNGIKVAGIEAIKGRDGQVYTYDINVTTNYNAEAEQAANKCAMSQLAKYLGSLLA